MKKNLRMLLPAICISVLALATSHAAEGWKTDYQAGLVQAQADDKMVLLDFTGSDWCGWCIKLVKDTFSKPAFEKFADENLVLVELDFPQGKEQAADIKAQNKKLSEEYGVEGFPTLVLLNSAGKEIARNVGYLKGGPEGFIDWVNAAKAK